MRILRVRVVVKFEASTLSMAACQDGAVVGWGCRPVATGWAGRQRSCRAARKRAASRSSAVWITRGFCGCGWARAVALSGTPVPAGVRRLVGLAAGDSTGAPVRRLAVVSATCRRVERRRERRHERPRSSVRICRLAAGVHGRSPECDGSGTPRPTRGDTAVARSALLRPRSQLWLADRPFQQRQAIASTPLAASRQSPVAGTQ